MDHDWPHSVFSNDGYPNHSSRLHSWPRCAISGEKGNLKHAETELSIFVIKDRYHDTVIDDHRKKYAVA